MGTIWVHQKCNYINNIQNRIEMIWFCNIITADLCEKLTPKKSSNNPHNHKNLVFIRVASKFAITGYNNSILALSSEPELTSVDSKLEIMCKKTVERMISLLENDMQIEKNICVPCEIIRRCTTDF